MFTMPTKRQLEETRNNLSMQVPDGQHLATIIGIRNGEKKEGGFPYYLFDYCIEIEGRPVVTDYICLEDPKTASFSEVKLADMAFAMLKLQPGETYDPKDFIQDFMYKSACIDIKNKKDKDGYMKPRIAKVLSVTDRTENKIAALNQSAPSFSQQQMHQSQGGDGVLSGDNIPW